MRTKAREATAERTSNAVAARTAGVRTVDSAGDGAGRARAPDAAVGAAEVGVTRGPDSVTASGSAPLRRRITPRRYRGQSRWASVRQTRACWRVDRASDAPGLRNDWRHRVRAMPDPACRPRKPSQGMDTCGLPRGRIRRPRCHVRRPGSRPIRPTRSAFARHPVFDCPAHRRLPASCPAGWGGRV
jgi:hypothetical protein